MSFLKKETTPPVSAAPAGGPDVGSAADVEAVMKKYDRESNTRYWEGIPKLVIQILMAAFCRIQHHRYRVFIRSAAAPSAPIFMGMDSADRLFDVSGQEG